MLDSNEAIRGALALHQAGRLEEATRIYRQVLAAEPRNATAMHLLGLVAFQSGDAQRAVEWISQAIRIDGGQAAFHANLGEAYRGLGRLDQAEASYRQALKLRAELPEAHNNLGTILQSRGKLDEAITHYQAAIAARPAYADGHNNLGTAYQQQGRWEDAIDCFRQAVAVAPDYVRGYYNLGNALQLVGRLDDAQAALTRAIGLDDRYAAAHYVLGAVLQKREHLAEAEAEYRRALAIAPDMAEAHSSLGMLYQSQGRFDDAIAQFQKSIGIRPDYAGAYYNWGATLVAMGRSEEAEAKYRKAIHCQPDFADAHYNLGTVLQKLDRQQEAAAAYEESIRLRPEFIPAHNNLGNLYERLGRPWEAVECFRRALAAQPARHAARAAADVAMPRGTSGESLQTFQPKPLSKPHAADAYNNLANMLHFLGQDAEALECYRKSLQLAPDFAEAHHNLGLYFLGHERFAEGWPEYLWRLKSASYPARNFSQPLWQGEDLAGRTLLVHAEQGFGDTLQMLRYIPWTQSRGGRVILEVQPQLAPLVATSGYREVIAGGSRLPPFDLQVPILNLPAVFGTTLGNMPAKVPYLTADPRRVDTWRQKLSTIEGFKVGIAWQGNRAYAYDRERSIALAHFEPLAAVWGVRLVSLQKFDTSAQLAEVAGRFAVVDLGPELDQHGGAFMDTAAVMMPLDLVITSDSAIAHLAGALGVPVWVALPKAPDWRWFLDRDDSPWYPTMRLFRQRTAGDWPEVFARIAAELAAISQRSRSAS